MNLSKIATGFFLALLAALVIYLFFGDYGVKTYIERDRELERLKATNRELTSTNEELAEQIRLLTEDDRAIQAAIRQELGYVKDGEIVVFFEDDDDDSTPEAKQTPSPTPGDDR